MNVSIRSRLFISASLVLAAFLGLTGIALDKGYQDSAETAVQARLQAHVYTLLAAAELGANDSLVIPAELPEPRFSSPDSGLVAMVSDANGKEIWRSRSLLGLDFGPYTMSPVGQWRFERLTSNLDQPFVAASFVASWAGSNKNLYRFRFTVAEDYRFTGQQIARFSRTLWSWLAAAGLILLAAQGTILRWSLAPLKQAENEIAEIESGQRKRLSGDYPKELKQLTERLNALVENSDKHLQRYRDSLGNLAHSLKTPLAVLRNAVTGNSPPETLRTTADEQLARMVEIIDHQLQRAAMAGRSVLSEPLAVAGVVNKLVSALQKVYAEKAVRFTLDDANHAVFRGDEGDLYELAGNLLDNAFKWCRTKVRLTLSNIEHDNLQRLLLCIEDDGPGIPEEQRDNVLQRGGRTDPAAPGHGLGLDMVRETVAVYQGKLNISSSELGGVRIEVLL